MDAKRSRLIAVLLATGLVVLIAVLVFVHQPEPAAPGGTAGPAEAPDPAAGEPSAARAADPRPAASPDKPAAVPRRLPEGVRAKAIDPQARRAMLTAILDKIAQRQAKRKQSAPAASQAPEAAGSLPKEYIQQQVGEIVPLIKECYEMALETQPKLDGTMKVRFTIVGDEDHGGLVTDSQVLEESSLAGNADMVECVRETMYAIRLDAPEGGGQVVVNYPFIFKSSASLQDDPD